MHPLYRNPIRAVNNEMHPLYRNLIRAVNSERWPTAHRLLNAHQDELSQMLPGAYQAGLARGQGAAFDPNAGIPIDDLLSRGQHDLIARLLDVGANPYWQASADPSGLLADTPLPWYRSMLGSSYKIKHAKAELAALPSVLDAMIRMGRAEPINKMPISQGQELLMERRVPEPATLLSDADILSNLTPHGYLPPLAVAVENDVPPLAYEMLMARGADPAVAVPKWGTPWHQAYDQDRGTAAGARVLSKWRPDLVRRPPPRGPWDAPKRNPWD